MPSADLFISNNNNKQTWFNFLSSLDIQPRGEGKSERSKISRFHFGTNWALARSSRCDTYIKSVFNFNMNSLFGLFAISLLSTERLDRTSSWWDKKNVIKIIANFTAKIFYFIFFSRFKRKVDTLLFSQRTHHDTESDLMHRDSPSELHDMPSSSCLPCVSVDRP